MLLGVWMILACGSPEIPDGFYVGDPRGVHVPLTRDDGKPASARLGEPFVPTAPVLYAIDNDNARYRLEGGHTAPLEESWAYFRLDGRTRGASTVGGGSTGPTVSFELDRAWADGAAAMLGIPRRDRVALDEGITGVFVAEPVRVGEPIRVTVRLEKASGDPVGLVTGGRDRGLRDNRFAFEVLRDGVALPAIDASDFGGAWQVRPFAAGDAIEATADLGAWVDLREPGTYEVRCTYTAELRRAGGADGPEQRHERWDLRIADTLTLVVLAPEEAL